MAPRPILKRSSGSNQSAHVVHFPPSPSLTCTFDTFSPAHYDRSPIVVSPNTCALPERGCPGRTYTLDDEPSESSASYFSFMASPTIRGHLHPIGLRQKQSEYNSSVPPPLVQDLSSESDESDGFISAAPELVRYSVVATQYSTSFSYTEHCRTGYSTPPSYPSQSPPRSYGRHTPSPESSQKSRRRRDRDCQPQPERDHRIRNNNVASDDIGYEDDRDIAKPFNPSSVSPERKKCSIKRLAKTFSGFGMQDDTHSCLGGF